MNNRDSHSTINFYGERGIVNSIVLFLAQNDNNLKGFLNSIRFINNKQCFCNINENISITDIHYWVELSLSQFGNPDLIIDFKMNDKTHILFIEAKLTDFIKASSKGIIDFKDSSLLNIQLLLKERFVQALNNEKNNGKDRTRIEEKDIKETDLKREKRALGKQSILEKIKYFNKDCIFYYIGLVTNKDTEIDALDEKIKQLMPSENVDNLNIGIINYNNIAEMINERNDVYTQMFNFAWEITGMKTDNNYYTEGDNGSLFDDNTDLISFLDEAIIEIRKKQKINFIKTENTESW